VNFHISFIQNVFHHILSPSSEPAQVSLSVVHHQGRPIPCSSKAETAAASQHSGGQASEGPGEDPRPALGTALGATVSAWQCHSAGTGSSNPARGGGFEQPYGAQAFRGAEEGPVSTQLLRYIFRGLTHHWQANSFRHGMV